uniref:probable CCR4-associated factor 1 homolog 11 isoform X2 n=1 Tax=Fragaria vesca subsp. vesca TaxID=101020 RepID=UPI0005C9B3AB|nr:PREDICTED: probable CCR4-associated factor 1 homolog 11 isoform X2 [Fragaria vesca subsp. vesca]
MMIVQRGIPLFPISPAPQFRPTPPIALLHHRPYPPPLSPVKISDRVEVRKVCRYNLKAELAVIQTLIRTGFRVASFDTEFPGTVVPSKVPRHLISQAGPADVYEMMKANVDKTHIIQLGLSLCDPCGNLPVYDGAYCCWEFNFSDFDVECDDHMRNSDSIDLLERQGIDFSENRATGICSADFAEEIVRSGLAQLLPCLTWATFQCAYDFGYLVKVFSGKKELPEDVNGFMSHVKAYFGHKVYDIKYMMRYCDRLFGGLDRVAETLGVCRVAGSSHQAGSDSLLTLQTFIKILNMEKSKGKELSEIKRYPYAHVYEYSKLFLLLFSYELHRQLGLLDISHHIFVNAVDPDVVETKMMREFPPCLSSLAFKILRSCLLQSPEVGIGSILDAVVAPPLAKHRSGERI